LLFSACPKSIFFNAGNRFSLFTDHYRSQSIYLTYYLTSFLAHCALRHHQITGVYGMRQPQEPVCPAGTQAAKDHITQIPCQEEKRRKAVMDELI